MICKTSLNKNVERFQLRFQSTSFNPHVDDFGCVYEANFWTCCWWHVSCQQTWLLKKHISKWPPSYWWLGHQPHLAVVARAIEGITWNHGLFEVWIWWGFQSLTLWFPEDKSSFRFDFGSLWKIPFMTLWTIKMDVPEPNHFDRTPKSLYRISTATILITINHL